MLTGVAFGCFAWVDFGVEVPKLLSQCRHRLMHFSQTALSCRCRISEFVVPSDLGYYVYFNKSVTKADMQECLCSLVSNMVLCVIFFVMAGCIDAIFYVCHGMDWGQGCRAECIRKCFISPSEGQRLLIIYTLQYQYLFHTLASSQKSLSGHTRLYPGLETAVTPEQWRND